ncbi:MAG: carbohydrate ABC transporter permease, partial [Rhodococcus sp. (in: high G+C Gram-positive bacteria)]
MRSFTLGSVAVRVGIVLLCVLWFIPTLGLLISSFRDEADVKSSGWWTVITDPFSQWTLDSYTQVLESGMANAFVNSIVVSVPATVLPIMIAAFAAYAFTFMRFPGRNVLFMLIVGLLVVPLQVA